MTSTLYKSFDSDRLQFSLTDTRILVIRIVTKCREADQIRSLLRKAFRNFIKQKLVAVSEYII